VRLQYFPKSLLSGDAATPITAGGGDGDDLDDDAPNELRMTVVIIHPFSGVDTHSHPSVRLRLTTESGTQALTHFSSLVIYMGVLIGAALAFLVTSGGGRILC
jgi:hypothetical protein